MAGGLGVQGGPQQVRLESGEGTAGQEAGPMQAIGQVRQTGQVQPRLAGQGGQGLVAQVPHRRGHRRQAQGRLPVQAAGQGLPAQALGLAGSHRRG
jgi:hypothetical protein